MRTIVGRLVPAAFWGIAMRIVPIPKLGFGIPPPVVRRLCDIPRAKRPFVGFVRLDIDVLFQPPIERIKPDLLSLPDIP
jgi:hypothetical protein